MRVFILGGTGSIGTAVTQSLLAHGHTVTALARSEASSQKLQDMGAKLLHGDIRSPENWTGDLEMQDCIIQLATTFDEDMAIVDRRLLWALEQSVKKWGDICHILYTGGCWLYGETGDEIAGEDYGFKPIHAFSWMVEGATFLENSPQFEVTIIHPALVYHKEGGAFSRYLDAVHSGKNIEIWGNPEARWPLIHRDDLAEAYRVLAENPNLTGHFNAVAETGVKTQEIARWVAQDEDAIQVIPRDEVLGREGEWAQGPMLDQQLSAQKLLNTGLWVPKYLDYKNSDV